MWKCTICAAAKGRVLIIQYELPNGKGDATFNACSHCDAGELWPNYVKQT